MLPTIEHPELGKSYLPPHKRIRLAGGPPFFSGSEFRLGQLNRDGSCFVAPWGRDEIGLYETDLIDPETGRRIKIAPLAGGAGLALIEQPITTITPQSIGTTIQPFFIDMPRDFMYAGLLLDVQATVTVAGGTTNGTLNDENPMSFLDRLVFAATGSGASVELKNVRGVHAFRAHHLLVGKESNASPLGSAGIGGPTAVRAIIPVWFALPGNQIPPEVAVQSILDPSEYGKLTLELDLGTPTSFINGGDRTVTVPSAQVDVYALQPVNVAITKNRPYRYIEQFFLRDVLAAVASERRLTNPIPTGRPIRYIMLRTTNEVSNTRQPVDDTLGTIKLKISQTQVLRQNNFRLYAQRNRDENRVFDAVNPAGLNALSSRDNPVIGYYMFDWAKGGRLDGLLDASRFPSRGVPIDLLHDVATASARQLDVVLGYLVPGGAR